MSTRSPAPPRLRLSDRLSRGALWVVAARAVMMSSLMINTIILARLLGPEAFGLVAVPIAIVGIVEMATKMNLSSALVQTKSITSQHFDTAFTLNLFRGALIGGTMMLLAHPIATSYGDDRLLPIMIALGLSTSIYGISNPKIALFQRDLVFWQEFARTSAERFAIIAVSIPIALLFRSYWAIVAGMAAGQLALVVSSFVFKPYRPRLSLACARELLSFSVWVSLTQFVRAVAQRMDDLLIGYVLGSTILGNVTVASKIAAAPTREVAAPLQQTAFPGFAKLWRDPGLLRPAYQRVQTMTLLMTLPVAVGMVFIAEPLVRLFLGDEWSIAILVIQLLAGSFGLGAMASSVNPLAMSMGRTRTLFIRAVIGLAIRIPLILTGLFTAGLVGLLVARIIATVAAMVLNMSVVRHLIGLSILSQLMANGRTLGATGVMALALWAADPFLAGGEGSIGFIVEIALKAALGALSFLVSMAGLWTVSGRPHGPEMDMLTLVGSLLTKVKARAL